MACDWEEKTWSVIAGCFFALLLVALIGGLACLFVVALVAVASSLAAAFVNAIPALLDHIIAQMAIPYEIILVSLWIAARPLNPLFPIFGIPTDFPVTKPGGAA